MLHFQFSHVWIYFGGALVEKVEQGCGPLFPVFSCLDIFWWSRSLDRARWRATLGPVARADDGRAADNGSLLSGQQVEVVVAV